VRSVDNAGLAIETYGGHLSRNVRRKSVTAFRV
jgi:hypothetical protein